MSEEISVPHLRISMRCVPEISMGGKGPCQKQDAIMYIYIHIYTEETIC